MGGIETHCEQVYPRLAELGYSITVIARSSYCKNDSFGKIKIVPLFSFKQKSLETILHTLYAMIYARLFIHPNIIHIHAIGPALLTPFAKLLGFKVVVTHHGADYNRQKWSNFAKNLLKIGEKFAVIFADKVVVVGKTLTDEIQSKYPKHAAKVVYIPNGCPISSVEQKNTVQTAEVPNLDINNEKYILFVGRLVPEKGVHDLISAFNIARLDNTKLLIVGSSDFKDAYYHEVVSIRSDTVIFAGQRSKEEIACLYQNASLFVLPSYHEGLPIVALEALSFSCPILLSNIAPNLDVGLAPESYFEVGNVAQLSTLLGKSYEPYYAASILDRFNWDTISSDLGSVFDEI